MDKSPDTQDLDKRLAVLEERGHENIER